MKRTFVLLAALAVLAALGGCCTVNPASHADAFVKGLELNAKTSGTLATHLVPFLEGEPLPLSEAAKKKDDPEAWEKKHLIALLKQHKSHSMTLAKKGGGFEEKDAEDK
jgi:hypothetical protein